MPDKLRLGRDGNWLVRVKRVPSPNCDERPPGTAIDLVVIHGISLPPGQYGGTHVDQLFTNSLSPDAHPYFAEVAGLRVSAHVFVSRSGRLTQYVPFGKRAWHAGQSSFEGRSACNDFSIGIELEGCDDDPYEAKQYESAAAVTRLLMQRWPGITGRRVTGHSDIAPGRKTDPGPAFDWKHFRRLLLKKGSE